MNHFMKTKISFFFFCVILISALFFQSCQKDDASPSGHMKAKVSDVNWMAKDVGAQIIQGIFNLTGKAADGSIMTITLQATTEGNYGLAANTDHAAVWLPAGGGSSTYVSNAPEGVGYVTINTFNTTDSIVSGVFEFIVQNPLDGEKIFISEGEFNNVPFTTNTVPVADNFLNVKINGTSFMPLQVTGSKALGKLVVNATDASAGQTVGLTMPASISPGDYQLGNLQFGSTYGGQYNPNGQTFLSSTSGMLEITKHDKTYRILEGTFSFEASSFFSPMTASLTEGSFSVHY